MKGHTNRNQREVGIYLSNKATSPIEQGVICIEGDGIDRDEPPIASSTYDPWTKFMEQTEMVRKAENAVEYAKEASAEAGYKLEIARRNFVKIMSSDVDDG